MYSQHDQEIQQVVNNGEEQLHTDIVDRSQLSNW